MNRREAEESSAWPSRSNKPPLFRRVPGISSHKALHTLLFLSSFSSTSEQQRESPHNRAVNRALQSHVYIKQVLEREKTQMPKRAESSDLIGNGWLFFFFLAGGESGGGGELSCLMVHKDGVGHGGWIVS